jgi:hypothetical protein
MLRPTFCVRFFFYICSEFVSYQIQRHLLRPLPYLIPPDFLDYSDIGKINTKLSAVGFAHFISYK